MNIKRTLIGATSAAALAASVAAVPSQANALPVWVVPAIIGAGVVGVVTGAATHPVYAAPVAVAPAPPYAEPYGDEPYGSNCRVMHERIPGGWRPVTVCD